MNKSLLDTDLLSEIHKGRNKPVMHRARSYRAEWGGMTLSAVTFMEVVRGHWTTGNTELLRGGKTIGLADPMIAATALEHGLVLVTGNARHFERIGHAGFPLRLANWREADS